MTTSRSTPPPSPSAQKSFRGLDPRAWAGRLLLVPLLLAPSIWLLICIPPLWRDLDAYAQVTYAAGVATLIRHGPLYCFVARIPLFVGFAFDCARSGAPLPTLSFFQNPTLCDSGVFLLILLQHIGLGLVSFAIIHSASTSPVIRIALAALWASNPLFYSFAHCVGSETMSLLLTLALAATGLRLLRNEPAARSRDWICYGMLLVCAILSRFVNTVLVVILPLTFVLDFAGRLFRHFFIRKSDALDLFVPLRRLGLALVLGLTSILLASGTVRLLCRLADTPYRSAVGYTFLWRLQFLDRVPPQTRDQLLATAERSATSADAAILMGFLREQLQAGSPFKDIGAFLDGAGFLLPESEPEKPQMRLDLALTDMMKTFMAPPDKVLLEAAQGDFLRNCAQPETEVVLSLFRATNYYFVKPEMMPGLAKLVTYRGRDPATIQTDFRKHRFFHQWKNCSYALFFAVWLIALLGLGFVGIREKSTSPFSASYPIALTFCGQLILLASCLLTDPLPRFSVPMWALTIVSMTLLLGSAADSLTLRKNSAPESTRSDPKLGPC